MRKLFALTVAVVALCFAPAAKAECRYTSQAVVVQQAVPVQAVQYQYAQPVQAVQFVPVQQHVVVQRSFATNSVYGGFAQAQPVVVQRGVVRQRAIGGGGSGLGSIINRQNLGSALGAGAGAALFGPFGAAGGAVLGNILFGN